MLNEYLRSHYLVVSFHKGAFYLPQKKMYLYGEIHWLPISKTLSDPLRGKTLSKLYFKNNKEVLWGSNFMSTSLWISGSKISAAHIHGEVLWRCVSFNQHVSCHQKKYCPLILNTAAFPVVPLWSLAGRGQIVWDSHADDT